MIQELVVLERPARSGPRPILLLYSDAPEEDLLALAPFRLGIRLAPGSGNRIEVVRVGLEEPLVQSQPLFPRTLSSLRARTPVPLALGCLKPEKVAYFLFPGWPGEADDAGVQEVLANPSEWTETELRAHLERHEDPRLLVLLADLLAEAGRTVEASAANLRALEIYPNFVPSLQRLIGTDPDPVLSRLALSRLLGLLPGQGLTRLACQELERRWGKEARQVAERGAGRIDLMRPFRDQWSGALWTEGGSRDPLEPSGIYQICLEHCLRDGHFEDWERELTEQMGTVLDLTEEEQAAALERARQTLRRRQEGVLVPEPLNREELFRCLAEAVQADGVFEEEELACLERIRGILGIPGERARDLLMVAGERQHQVWIALRQVMERPEEGKRLQNLQELLFPGEGSLRPGLSDTYAAVLDEVRIEMPALLAPLLPPLPEVERYSARLVRALEAALEVAPGGSRAGCEAAMALARVNPRRSAFHVAIGRGLRRAMKMRKLAPGLILEYLEELKVFSPRSRELVQASRTMKLESSSGTEPLTPFPVERRRSGSMGASSSENPFVRPPLDRAKKHLETIERAAYEGDRRLLLQSLERLGRLQARTPEVAYLEQLGRTEASLAASFHGWQDVLTVCLDWDLQDAGTRSGGWFTWVRLMAGADLACRQGRGQDLDGLLLRLQMTPGKEALTPVQQAYLERWQASLSEVASLPLDRLP